MSSERHMRLRASYVIGSNISAETVPLSFQHKAGGKGIKQAPIASIPDLWDRIVSLYLSRMKGMEKWHYVM